jgi:uncharacterized membrane protein YkoI
MKTKTSIAIVSALVLATTATAFAAKSTETEAMAIADAKVSLIQAITTAEQHASGKALRAELESGKKGALYDIEVVSGAKTMDIQVDAQSGVVIASTEDRGDREGDDDNDKRD